MEKKRVFKKKVKVTEGTGISAEIESDDGTVLMERNDVRDRWREYYSELLGGEQTVDLVMEEDLEREVEGVRNGMLEEEITKEEIKKRVWKLKKGEAGGLLKQDF